MQNILFKIIIFIFISTATISNSCFSQDLNYDLNIADSLFEKGKYTESFEIYSAILETAEQLSPAMLLKMAYIKEGLHDNAGALYYLNLYYLKTSDKHTLNKMEDLASSSELEGFAEADRNMFMHYVYDHFNLLIGILFIIIVGLAIIALYSKYKLKVKPYSSSVLLIIFLIGLFYLVNFARLSNDGIIIEQGGFIMSGPSAGANLVDSPQIGHKIKILGKEDVWMKIEWKGKPGYIKSKFVKTISF